MAKKDAYRVLVVGAGMIGQEMVKVLRQRKFPMSELKILARSNRKQVIAGEEYDVKETKPEEFDGFDLAFFAGTEGEKGACVTFGPKAVKKGVVCIDNGADFRMKRKVPLVVPEVNPDALKTHQGIIANPNCSTVQMVMAIYPIHKLSRIKRVWVATYQAVSGTGTSAYKELQAQVRAWAEGKPLDGLIKEYPVQIAFNLFPKIGDLEQPPEKFPGYYKEEIKMIQETQKIMGDRRIKVTATCVRVPVLNGHSEAITVETEAPVSVEQAREALRNMPGVVLMDEPEKGIWPHPLIASGNDATYVGRVRKDSAVKNGLSLFCVADNIRKGGALNAVQIAEKMMEMNLI
jgi:aspartate-semialdehyde dehydrogenase